jgi:hypothetical protein
MARKWLGPPKEPRPRVVPGGTWIQRHPTRYGWDPDVRDLVDRLFREFTDIGINTYAGHPEFDESRSWGDILGYNTQRRSLDVWHAAGRGVPIWPEKGTHIVNYVFNDPRPPWISWVIWQGMIWSRNQGGVWVPYDDDGTGLHFDHPHFTMMPRGWRP